MNVLKPRISKWLSISVLASFIVTLSSVTLKAQTQTASEQTNAQRIAQMQEQILLLQKEKELADMQSKFNNRRLDELMQRFGGQKEEQLKDYNSFEDSRNKSPEIIALSYQAVNELVPEIRAAISPSLSRYSSIVIYREQDFAMLPRFRLFKDQAVTVLKNYDEVTSSLRENTEAKATNSGIKGASLIGGGLDRLSAVLSAPSIGTSVAYSVAGLIRTFRTESKYTATADTIDESVFGAILSNEIVKQDSRLKLFYPEVFSPDYALAGESDGSVLSIIMRLNEAKALCQEVLSEWDKLPEAKKLDSNLGVSMARLSIIDRQLDGLASIFGEGKEVKGADNSSGATTEMLRLFMRADKLDRFLRGGDPTRAIGAGNANVGVLHIRLLGSGGTRKTTQNLFRGSTIGYSGMAVVEIMLFDVDGTLRDSRVFSRHTGFQKMSTGK